MYLFYLWSSLEIKYKRHVWRHLFIFIQYTRIHKYIFEIMILENIMEMNKRRVWSSNYIWWMESVWMMCMGVCTNYRSFEYESPQLSSVALNAVHTLYLGILFFLSHKYAHHSKWAALSKWWLWSFFFDVSNDPEPLMILIDLAFVSSQQFCTKLKLKIFFLVFKRSSYLIEETIKVIQCNCIVSTVNCFS